MQNSVREKDRLAAATSRELNEIQVQYAQEKMRASTFEAQIQVTTFLIFINLNLDLICFLKDSDKEQNKPSNW